MALDASWGDIGGSALSYGARGAYGMANGAKWMNSNRGISGIGLGAAGIFGAGFVHRERKRKREWPETERKLRNWYDQYGS